ncbi:hypothetical protein DZD52_21810 [Xanthomonas nasturtii]|uniref:Uncharacterized protein n=1 Tax=Xanthomonas nasturtii TaxID=1843581 RepID=A0A3E1KDJ3_9XANT|nr:hypothetical protein DZD52_21810 [Xanthomonas nasturtii]
MTSVSQRELESFSPNLLLQSLQEINMGLCVSKPSVSGSPEHYATHATEQVTPSESSSPSRRESPSSSISAPTSPRF